MCWAVQEVLDPQSLAIVGERHAMRAAVFALHGMHAASDGMHCYCQCLSLVSHVLASNARK